MQLQKGPGNKTSFWQNPDLIIWLILLVLFLAGLLMVTQYSESWDEPFRYDFASRSLAAYSGVNSNLADEKGPFYGMLAILGSNALRLIIPTWYFIDGWHFMTYLSFLAGIYFFYRLCRRLIDPVPALVATLLFGSQPVIWGHAFINPKDMPFMAFFLGSVSLGLAMVDKFQPLSTSVDPPAAISGPAAGDWQSAPPAWRRLLIGLGLAWFGLPLLFPLVQEGITEIISQFYYAPPSSSLERIFSSVAQHTAQAPLFDYVHRAEEFSNGLGVLAWFGLGLAMVLAARRVFPSFAGWLRFQPGFSIPIRAYFRSGWARVAGLGRDLARDFKAGPWYLWFLLPALLVLLGMAVSHDLGQPASSAVLDSDPARRFAGVLELILLLAVLLVASRLFPSLVGAPFKQLAQPQLWLAACFLGFCSAIRTLGPASGLLVGVYFLFKFRHKAIPAILAYFAISAIVTYLFWPYLWNAPLNHYSSSLAQAENFEGNGPLTFAGFTIYATEPPARYLPTLMGLQFTETALAMIGAGVVLALIYLWKRPTLRLDMLLLAAWFVAPAGAAMVLNSSMYNDFRQYLFLVPPLFIVAGLFLQAVWNLLGTRKVLYWLFALALLLSGIYWDIQLHPYEYVYYNSLTGGDKGAFRFYELDYWATSYKEDIEYVNKVAPQGAKVLVFGQQLIAAAYARPDLLIMRFPLPPDSFTKIDYAILLTERNTDQLLYPEAETVFQVERDGAIFSVVKRVHTGEPVTPEGP